MHAAPLIHRQKSNMNLRGAVVGVGYLGQFHAQKIKAHPEADLVGVCDFSFEQAQKVAGLLATHAFKSPVEMLGQVDFVQIAASTQAHYDLASFFLEQKIPVLVEKPIAATIEQAEKLCQLAEKNSTLFTVGHIERFSPAFKYLKDNSSDVTYLEINRLAPFRIRGSDVSVLHDLMIHDIDLVSWVFGAEIKKFSAAGKKLIRPTFDDVSVRLELTNGVQVTINNSRVTPQIVRNYRAVGKDKTIFMNTATLEGEVLRPESKDPFYSTETVKLEKADTLALETDHFIQCVLGKKTPAISAREALQALVNVEKFIAALEGTQN